MIRSNFWNPPLFRTLPDIQMVVKAADETVNNSNVLQDDDELLFPIGANETWFFSMVLIMQQADASADWKYTVTGPAGATGYWFVRPGFNLGAAAWALGASQTGTNATTSPVLLEIAGVVVNGATAGNIQLQWAQSVQTVADNKILAASFLTAQRLS